MPSEERPGRGADRCGAHPSQPAIARCDVCGRAMCLACAVPVRGGTVGSECLATVLGPDVPVDTTPPAREPAAAARTWARVAFSAAVLATLLPWSRFGPGSEPFGAWSDSPRWSMVAALAAVAGFLLSLAGPPSRWDVVSGVLAGAVCLGSLLGVLRPPPFASPWVGPWVAAVAGGVALASIAVARRGAAERNPAHV